MLRTRLIVGAVLAAVAGCVLAFDQGPYFPGMLVLAVVASALATLEFRALMPAATRPRLVPALLGVLAVMLANWLPRADSVSLAFAGVVLAAFLVEMWVYRDPGHCVTRIAHTVLLVAYLGVLGGFFVRLRFLPEDSLIALLLAVFVPKGGDIGAYFVGRFLGKHRFSPRLSPKKTWEGFAGGLAASAGVAIGLSFAAPLFPGGIAEAAGFGVCVGLAGVLGDLAESLVKRDAAAKDASASIPGFGGILDVIDSVLFAAPLVWWWVGRP